MSLQTFPVRQFGGLNLLGDPEDMGPTGAVDCKNVVLGTDGVIRTRQGYTSWVTLPAGSVPTNILTATLGGTACVLVSASVSGTPKILVYNASTAALLSTNTITGNSALSSVVVGTPTATAAYFANQAGGIYKFDGAAVTHPVTTIDPQYVCLSAVSNRLVAARDNSFPHRVWFSNAGAPETFTYSAGPPETGNFVDLSPGDGEEISGIVSFGNQIFVFKQTKFFVFYGESTDSTGNPVFNVRSVTLGIGAQATGNTINSVVAATDRGVYFLGDRGLYRTTGGAPERVSRVLDPFFDRAALPSCPTLNSVASGQGALDVTSVFAAHGKVYIVIGLVATLVYDESYDAWTVYVWPAVTAAVPFKNGLLMGDAFSGKLFLHHPLYTDDNGTGVAWRYQSGWYDIGFPSRQKVIRWSRVTGTGTATFERFADFASTDANSAALTLGSSAASTTPHLKAWRGTLMSHKLSGTGAATVESLAHDVSTVRPPGLG